MHISDCWTGEKRGQVDESEIQLGNVYTGTVPCGTVRIGLAFTRELMEPFHTELLAVPELVHLESRSRTEPNQKVLV